MQKVTNVSRRAFRGLNPDAASERNQRDIVIGPGEVAEVSDELAAALLSDFPKRFRKGAVKVAQPDDDDEGGES